MRPEGKSGLALKAIVGMGCVYLAAAIALSIHNPTIHARPKTVMRDFGRLLRRACNAGTAITASPTQFGARTKTLRGFVSIKRPLLTNSAVAQGATRMLVLPSTRDVSPAGTTRWMWFDELTKSRALPGRLVRRHRMPNGS